MSLKEINKDLNKENDIWHSCIGKLIIKVKIFHQIDVQINTTHIKISNYFYRNTVLQTDLKTHKELQRTQNNLEREKLSWRMHTF